MIRRLSVILVLILFMMPHAMAADLPAELVYDNLVSQYGQFCYVTKDGELCLINESSSNGGDINDYSSEHIGTYFDNIKTLCSGYIQSVYLPGSNSLINRLLIKNDGTLWSYSIENGIPSCNKVEGIENCIKACTGGRFAVALLSDGTVYTWGYRFYGSREELQYDDPGYVVYPEKIEGLENIVDIAVRDTCAYALDSDGYVYTWGESFFNYSGENGIPQKITGIENCVEIDHGYAYLLARKSDGKVYQLADRYEFELSFPQKYYSPVLINNVNTCEQISAAPFDGEGIMLSADNKILYYEGSIFDVLDYGKPEYEEAEMHRVVAEEFGKPIEVAASTKYYIIMEDSSIWRMIYNDDRDIPEFKCAVPADAEDKIKVDSIKLVKRSEVAEQLMELYEDLTDETSITSLGCTYKDVDADSKYIEDIGKCCFLGLMNGTDAESFSPNKVLRREQLAVILDRLFSLTNTKCTSRTEAYADDSEISEWAKESVYKTASLFETSDGSYDPQEYVSYDELESVFEKVKSL